MRSTAQWVGDLNAAPLRPLAGEGGRQSRPDEGTAQATNSLAPMVDHSKRQYVISAVHANTIEGFWSLIKRGMVGTFHKVSKNYLPLYVAEFQFRYNNHLNADIFGAAIREC
jgi:hypothetical protein